MKLEERPCACGCGKIFKCLPTSQTKYSSLFCMELAGELPVQEKSGYGARAARPNAKPDLKKMQVAPGFQTEVETSPQAAPDASTVEKSSSKPGIVSGIDPAA